MATDDSLDTAPLAPPPAAPASGVRYEPPDRPPVLLTIGLALQLVTITVATIVITPSIIIRAAGGDETFLVWAVTMALIVSGFTTILQARKFGKVGAGYVLLMGTSGAFIAVSITAIAEGGPAMLATLVTVSSLFQFLFAQRMSLVRRFVTPTVAGTVIMLIPITIVPVIIDLLTDVPEGAHPASASVSSLITVAVIAALILRGGNALRLWAPVLGILAGILVANYFGIYQTTAVAEANWIGLPNFSGWPGLDLEFGPTFWVLLVSFLFVTQIGAVETIGHAVAIQRVSWRKPRATDFRAVQGAVNADGVGNLLSGLAGTVPNTTYSPSVALTDLTGVGARTVGACAGILLILFACFPKLLAVILTIPSPVVGAYASVLLMNLFIVGMRIVMSAGFDHRQSMIAAISFWVGLGFQSESLTSDMLPPIIGGLLQNGMTAGGLTAILLTAFVELTRRRHTRIEVPLDVSSLPAIQRFVQIFARRHGWGDDMAHRLNVVCEETLLTLGNWPDDKDMDDPGPDTENEEGEQKGKKMEKKEDDRNLLIIAHRDGNEAILEFIAGGGDDNIEDRLAVVDNEEPEVPTEGIVSLRLLDHIASAVRHQQYHNIDIVTVHIEASTDGA